MKIKAFVSMLALFVLGLAAPLAASAQSASGTYQLSFTDGYAKYLEFDAKTLSDGSA